MRDMIGCVAAPRDGDSNSTATVQLDLSVPPGKYSGRKLPSIAFFFFFFSLSK